VIQPLPSPFNELSAAERILLAQDLWDSVAAESDQVALTPSQREELKRRLLAHRANPKAALTWDEVKANLRARLQERRIA